jgi:hypothetical protein
LSIGIEHRYVLVLVLVLLFTASSLKLPSNGILVLPSNMVLIGAMELFPGLGPLLFSSEASASLMACTSAVPGPSPLLDQADDVTAGRERDNGLHHDGAKRLRFSH